MIDEQKARFAKVKKVFEFEKDDATGLYYMYKKGKSLGFGWREKVVWLSYPRKIAVKKAIDYYDRMTKI